MMVTTIDIRTAINQILVDAYPERVVYLDIAPAAFERPSFLVEIIKATETAANAGLVSVTVYATVTAFVAVDDYYNSETGDLLTVQQAVLRLFRCGYITVGDRRIGVMVSAGGRNPDEVYIDLQFTYFDRRDETPDPTPLIADVETTITTEED